MYVYTCTYMFYSDLPPVAYQQFLLPVVVIRIVTKTIMYNVRILVLMIVTSAAVFLPYLLETFAAYPVPMPCICSQA